MTLRSHLRLLACTALLFGAASAYAAGPDAAADMAPAQGCCHAKKSAKSMPKSADTKAMTDCPACNAKGMKACGCHIPSGDKAMKKSADTKAAADCPACKAKGMKDCGCPKQAQDKADSSCENGCSCSAGKKMTEASPKM